MTNEELNRLDALEKAATPGPWVYERSPGDMDVGYPDQFDVIAPNGDALCSMFTSDWGLAETHGKLIPALRNAAPALIAAARENARLRAVVEAARKYHAYHAVSICELVERYTTMTTEEIGRDICRGGALLDDLGAALSALDAKGCG